MDARDQQDCVCVLSEARDIVIEAKICGLPTGNFTNEIIFLLNGLENIGVINGRRLEPKFENVLDDVLNGRPPEYMTTEDLELIAFRHSEWFDAAKLYNLQSEATNNRGRLSLLR